MKQNDKKPQYSLIILAFFLTAFFSASAQAATHYVSAIGSASWANSTNISTPCSLATANTNANDGDIVYLRAGTYSTVDGHGVLAPDHSGSSGSPITFIKYPGETPIIDGSGLPTDSPSDAPAYLVYRSWITIDGLTFQNTETTWNILSGGLGSSMSSSVIIQNCAFDSMGGIYSKSLDGLQILNNTFTNITGAGINISGDDNHKSTNTKISGNTFAGTFVGTDIIVLHTASAAGGLHGVGYYHLIENNTITRTGYRSENCIDIESGSYVVVKSNTCTGNSKKPAIIVGGKTYSGGNIQDYIRFDGNKSYNSETNQEHFVMSGEDNDTVQWVRNIAYGTGEHNLAIGNSLAGGSSSDGLRIAHNVFDGREISDNLNIQINSTANGGLTDVRMKNNIIIFDRGDVGVWWAEPGAVDMLSDYNLYWNYNEKGDANLWDNAPTHTLAKIQSSFLSELKGIEADPLFSDLSGRDYSLKAKEHEYSPAIDAGAWLTTITSATGSGKSFKVDDPLWFYDGWNITGEIGDTIKTENGQTATITSINYSTGAITVDRSISWTNGEGIGLDYKGIRPDIGAKEYSSGILPNPKPIVAISSPKGFKVIGQ